MAKRLRILLTTDFYPPWPGIGTYVETLTTFFPQAQVTVLTYRLTDDPKLEKHGNVTIYRLGCTPILGKTFIMPQLRLPELPEHDLVITNTRFFTTTITGMRLARRWDVPHIHVEHGNQHVPHANPLVRFISWLWDQTIGRIVMRRADEVVCIAERGVPFVKKLGARKVIVIPNALDPADMKGSISLREETRKRYNIPQHARVIVFVGRLVREKGVQDLIQAMSGSDDWLLVVGEGKARKELESLCRELDVNARFIGNQDRAGVRAALAASDMFVNPSWAEGLPTSVLEALAAGLPVLATDVGGTRELLPARNLLQSRNPQQLRARMKKIPAKIPFPARYTLSSARKQWDKLVGGLT